MELLSLLYGTLVLRPYVFVFLAAYLVCAVPLIGWRGTLLWTVIGYFTAWACEYSSTHLGGFPFGVYTYVEATRGRELWVFGVPFFDSLSFVFLSFVSYRLTLFFLCPLDFSYGCLRIKDADKLARGPYTLFLSALLMTLIDVVTDPVTLRGEEWFLGKIYFYPNGGAFWGVTWENFLGWIFVGAAIPLLYLIVERKVVGVRAGDSARKSKYGWYVHFLDLMPCLLYFGIAAFSTSIAFLIGELEVGGMGLFLYGTLFCLMVFKIWSCRICGHDINRQ